MTYFLVVLEGEGILLLNKKIGSEDRILISDIRVLLVLGQRLDLRCRGSTLDSNRNPRTYYIRTYDAITSVLPTYFPSLAMAQNLGAMGSMIFLLIVQIESHSSETAACDGP